jgi:toxin FitB
VKSVVLDSSVWIEMLNDGPLGSACAKELNAAQKVIVPTVVLYEVYRKVAQSRSEDQALSVTALLSQHEVSELSREVALAAADISIQKGLGMADSLVLAHAQQKGATLVTLDNDFAGLAGARVLR